MSPQPARVLWAVAGIPSRANPQPRRRRVQFSKVDGSFPGGASRGWFGPRGVCRQ